MTNFIRTLLMASALICLTVFPAYALTFSSADLEGSWHGEYLESTSAGTRYWLQISAAINADGDVTSGNWSSSGGQSGTLTDGQFTITAQGALTGSLTYTGNTSGTIEIANGRMDQGKAMAYVTFQKPGGQTGTGLLSKIEDGGHSTADLDGSWKAILQETATVDYDYETYWIDTALSLGNLGPGSGTYNYQGAFSGSILTASLTLNATAGLGGSMALDMPPGATVTINNGQLNPALTCGSMCTTKNNGKLGAGVIIQTGGTGFTTADLAGTWDVFHLYVIDEGVSSNSWYWLAGEIVVNNSGTITSGSWVGPDPATQNGTYTSGSMAVADDGTLSGEFALSNAPSKTLTIEGGTMGLSKTFAGLVAKWGERADIGHTLDSIFMVKRVPETCMSTTVTPLLLLE